MQNDNLITYLVIVGGRKCLLRLNPQHLAAQLDTDRDTKILDTAVLDIPDAEADEPKLAEPLSTPGLGEWLSVLGEVLVEIGQQLLDRPYDPASLFRLCWTVVALVASLYLIVITPLRWAFEPFELSQVCSFCCWIRV